MAKVVVGMSGGVDSAVAAWLLKMAGHEVIGVTLKVWVAADGAESRCCEIEDARRVCWKLDIPYYAINCAADFRKNVTDPFVAEYLRGRTPNPCIECNRFVKWHGMLEAARNLGADRIATGHYASVIRLENGRYTVKTALHAEKDQTYMLYKLTQEQLAATIMPLGNLSKEEVRRIAREAGIPVAEKADSQEICFVTDGRYGDYIEDYRAGDVPGEGNFVDEDGNILGKHKGIYQYTPGQRKGLGIALGHPAYVKEIRAAANEVVLSSNEALFADEVCCEDVNFLSISELPPGEKLRCRAKIRYRHRPEEAFVEALPEGGVKLVFDRQVRAPAPGQSAVFYDEENRVIGGGIIRSWHSR